MYQILKRDNLIRNIIIKNRLINILDKDFKEKKKNVRIKFKNIPHYIQIIMANKIKRMHMRHVYLSKG